MYPWNNAVQLPNMIYVMLFWNELVSIREVNQPLSLNQEKSHFGNKEEVRHMRYNTESHGFSFLFFIFLSRIRREQSPTCALSYLQKKSINIYIENGLHPSAKPIK